ncbi:MAG: glycoside hydrolase family 27 protein, partial [Bacteroidaceae bacterium]
MRKLTGMLLVAAIALVPGRSSAQKWEGLADTPQMGWNSWNKFGQNISEKLIREQADAMVAE